jgi:hypothetical protein
VDPQVLVKPACPGVSVAQRSLVPIQLVLQVHGRRGTLAHDQRRVTEVRETDVVNQGRTSRLRSTSSTTRHGAPGVP